MEVEGHILGVKGLGPTLKFRLQEEEGLQLNGQKTFSD